MKITPKKFYQYIQARADRNQKQKNEQKALHYIEQSTSSVLKYIQGDEQRSLNGGEVLSYTISTRYREIQDITNRYLPYRWLTLANEAHDISKNDIDWTADPTVLIVGAGNRNPYTLALFFLMLGAKKVYCLEPTDIDPMDAMSRLYETVCQISFGIIECSDASTIENISKFIDVKALATGDVENVFKNDSIEVLQGVGEDIQLPDTSVDMIYSRAVMEHVKDIDQVYKENLRILKPKGCMVHQIGLCSHNADDHVSMYYEPLPSLAEFEFINKKRLSEHLQSIEDLGMSATVINTETSPLRDQEVLPEFQKFTKEDLAVIGALLFLKIND